MSGWPRSINQRQAVIVCAIVALSLFANAASGQAVEHFTLPAFDAARDLSAPVWGVNFDFFFPGPFPPHLSGGTITGNEYAALGLTIVQRDGLPMNVVSVFNAPGFFPMNSFGSLQVLSSSGAVGASNPALSDNFDFIFSNPPTAAGLWIGNLGPGTTEVQFLGAGNAILASEVFDATHAGVMFGFSGDPQDNGIFYGITSSQPIHRIRTIEPGGDGDMVCYDHLFWGTRAGGPAPDTDPPVVTIQSPSIGAVVGAQVFVAASVQDASSTTVTSVPAGMNASLPAGGGTPSATLSVAPPDGTYVVTVTAVDAGGRTGGTSVTVVRDTTPPLVTIDSPLEGAILPNAGILVSVTVADLTATTVVIAGNVVLLPAGGGPASASLVLVGGPNTIQVTATDAGGNSTTAIRNVVVDLTAPVVTIDSPLNGATFGPGESAIAVAVSVADASATTVTSTPAGITANLGPGGGLASGTIALIEGMNTIEVAATDAGNRTGQAFVLVNLDTTAPLVTLESPAANSVARGSIDLHASAEDVAPGTGISRVDLLVDNVIVASITTPPYAIAFDTTAIADGPHVVAAIAEDDKGNSGSASASILVDNSVPSITITAPFNGALVSGSMTFTASGSDAGSGLTRITMLAAGAAPTVDGSTTYAPPAASASCVSQVHTTLLPDGSLLLSATAEDSAGNLATASVLVTVDNTAPEKTLITPVDGAVVSGMMLIQAAASDPNLASIQLLVDSVVIATSTTSSISATFDTSTVASSTLTVAAVATDLLGNSSTCTATVTVANLVVVLDPATLNLKSKGGANSVTVVVEGANAGLLMPTEAHGLALRVPGGSPVPCTSGWPGDDATADTDSDGIPELRIKFDRQALIAAIRAGIAANLIQPDAPLPVSLLANGVAIGTYAIRIAGQ